MRRSCAASTRRPCRRCWSSATWSARSSTSTWRSACPRSRTCCASATSTSRCWRWPAPARSRWWRRAWAAGARAAACSTRSSASATPTASCRWRSPSASAPSRCCASRANTCVVHEARLRALLRSLPEQVWMKDRAGAYLAVNVEFERFQGIAEADVLGKTDSDMGAGKRGVLRGAGPGHAGGRRAAGVPRDRALGRGRRRAPAGGHQDGGARRSRRGHRRRRRRARHDARSRPPTWRSRAARRASAPRSRPPATPS